MELAEIITLVTFVVSFVLGIIAKKVPFVNDKMIPIQNLVVGIIIAVIEWTITKNFSVAIATSGLLAGGVYDVIHNLDKILHNK